MSKFLQAISKDYARGLVITLISVLVVVPLSCVLVFIPLGVVTRSNASIWWLIVPVGLFLLIMLGGGWGAIGWSFYRRKRWLDSVFTPLGLTGSTYTISGRQYRGTVQGREVTTRFYRGPTLDLYISTPLQTRLGIAAKSQVGLAVAGLFNRQALPLEDPDLDALSVFALDENWGHSLLADPEAKALLQRLMKAGDSWALMQQVHLQPGALYMRLYRNKNLFKYGFTLEEVQQRLDDLMALARIAESLPAPQVTAEETAAEQLVRSGRITSIALIVVAAILVASFAAFPVAFARHTVDGFEQVKLWTLLTAVLAVAAVAPRLLDPRERGRLPVGAAVALAYLAAAVLATAFSTSHFCLPALGRVTPRTNSSGSSRSTSRRASTIYSFSHPHRHPQLTPIS